MPEYLSDRGRETAAVWGGVSAQSPLNLADEEYQELLVNFLHNGMYSRTVLSRAVRELLAVAVLTALHPDDRLLAVWIRYALADNSQAEVMEAILQAGVYSGMPASSKGMRIFAEVLADSQDTNG